MAAVVIGNDGRGLRVEACRINQPNTSKLSLYKPLLSFLNSCTQATRWNVSVIKVGVVCVSIHVSRHLKEEPAWIIVKTASGY